MNKTDNEKTEHDIMKKNVTKQNNVIVTHEEYLKMIIKGYIHSKQINRCIKFDIFNTNISGVITINVTRTIWSSNENTLDIVKIIPVHMYSKSMHM